MYFNPPQNNHNDFYHPLNQVNEEKQFKARIAFMGEPRDNARDMRAAGRMGMYDLPPSVMCHQKEKAQSLTSLSRASVSSTNSWVRMMLSFLIGLTKH